MPQASKVLASAIDLSSSYKAYTSSYGDHWLDGANTGTADLYFSFAELGIPAGSIINWVHFRVESFDSPAHGTAERGARVNGNTISASIQAATDYDIAAYCSWDTNTIQIRFTSGTSGTTYPSAPVQGTDSRTNSGVLGWNNITIVVDYTLPNSAPTAPTSLTATPTLRESGNVSLDWSGQTDAEGNIDHFEIEYCTKPAGGSYGNWVSLGTDTSSPYSHSPSLSDGSVIKYRIRAVDAFGEVSGWKESNEVVQNSAPAASTSFAATPSLRESEAVSLAWSGQTDADSNIDHYEFEYCTKPAGGSYGSWVSLGTDTSSPYSHTPSLADGSRIKYRIRTVDDFGITSGWKESNEVVQNSAPTAPTSLTVTPYLRESGAVSLAWSGQTDADSNIDHFEIDYCTKPAGGSYGSWLSLTDDTASPYSHTPTLSDGSGIKYRIRSVDAFGVVSGWKESNEVIQNSAPTAPTSFTVTPSLRESGAVTLSWSGQTDVDGNIAYLEIQYAIRNTAGVWGNWLALKTSTGSSTTTTPVLADGERIMYHTRTVDALGVASGWKESNEVVQNSNPTAPTAFTATPPLRESGAVSLAWSGVTDVDGNIAYQEIQYCIRSVVGVWGAWKALKTATGSSTTTTPTLNDGERIKYMTRTVDALGATSGWKESNEVIQNTNPTAATIFTASPSLYESGDATLAWSGQTDPDNNISHQEIQYAIKPLGGSYGAWQALKTSTGSSTTTIPTLDRGAAIKYRTRTMDELGVSSDWKESNEVVRNSAPVTPAILFPGAGKTTYNASPYVGLSIIAEPNGQAQTLYFSKDGGTAQNAGAVTAGTKKLQVPSMAAGVHTIRYWLQDSQGAVSGEAAVTFTVAANTYARSIMAGTLLWDEVNGHRTSAEILELKSRVNQVRAFYGLTAISLPHEGSAGVHTIKHLHTWMPNMAALYQGLADTCAVSGAVAPARVTRERNAPSAGVINRVRGMIGSL